MIKQLDYLCSPRNALPALLLLSAACATKPVPRPYEAKTAATVIAALQADAAKIKTLRAQARVEHDGPGLERVKLAVGLLAARGGKLRVEAESPVGGAIATLTADGQRFAMLDVRENRFLAGPAQACNVARLLQVALSPDEIVAVLLGGAPLDGADANAKLDWDAKRGVEVLELQRPDKSRLRLSLRPIENGARFEIVRAEQLEPLGHVLYRVEHSDFEDRGNGIRSPQKTSVADLLRKKTLYIRYKEVEPNIDPPASGFTLTAPKGITAEEVTCN